MPRDRRQIWRGGAGFLDAEAERSARGLRDYSGRNASCSGIHVEESEQDVA